MFDGHLNATRLTISHTQSDFTKIEFTEKGVCRIEFKLLSLRNFLILRFLSYLVTILLNLADTLYYLNIVCFTS